MKRHRKAFWMGLAAEVESGKSLAEVAVQYSVKASTLRWWCVQLRRKGELQPRFLPVVLEPRANAAPIEIVVGNIVVRVGPSTEVGYVAALARAIERSC